MSSSDPKQGGDLFDMAATGTKIPGDAGNHNILPSIPRPDQVSDSNEMGSSTLVAAADNVQDIPRSTRDQGPSGSEVVSATGHTLPAEVDSKRLDNVPGGVVSDPAAKGSSRYEKHKKQKGSDQELGASDGAEVEAPPGKEHFGQDQLRDEVEKKE